MIHLSERQKQTLELLSYGLTNKAMAKKLFISEPTVKKHIKDILEKLNAVNRTEGVAKALRMHILE
ncbi:TPA: response regulator transcription factor [Candidatus Galligastranaerophilus gallistercoris]|nr:response regulator transcription factor [Candidatus Galligastranaerophilus gallistercoris]